MKEERYFDDVFDEIESRITNNDSINIIKEKMKKIINKPSNAKVFKENDFNDFFIDYSYEKMLTIPMLIFYNDYYYFIEKDNTPPPTKQEMIDVLKNFNATEEMDKFFKQFKKK